MAHVIHACTVRLIGLPSTIRDKTKRLQLGREKLSWDGGSTKKQSFLRQIGSAGYIHTPEERAHFSRSQAIAKYLERKTAVSPDSATTYGTHFRPFAQYIYRKHSKVEVDAFIEKLKRNIVTYTMSSPVLLLFLKVERKREFSPAIYFRILSSRSIRSMRYHRQKQTTRCILWPTKFLLLPSPFLLLSAHLLKKNKKRNRNNNKNRSKRTSQKQMAFSQPR
jgi:hypothetical protein